MIAVKHAGQPLALPFDRARFAEDALESTVAYVGVAEAAPGSARTERLGDGAIAIRTRIEGEVLAAGRGSLAIDQRGALARLRTLLPEAIDLGALVGHRVSITLSEKMSGGRCTADARIFDAAGGLVLWARDGELPEDRAAHGLALRMRMTAGGRALAIAHRGGLAVLKGPAIAGVQADGAALLALVLGTSDDEASFVLLRR